MKKRKNRSHDNQRIFIDKCFGNIDPVKGLSSIKYSAEYKVLVQSLTQILKTTNRASKFLVHNLFPGRYEEVFTANLLMYRSEELERELLWNAVILKKFNKVINKFNVLRNLYEVEFLNGNYKEAFQILNDIEKNT